MSCRKKVNLPNSKRLDFNQSTYIITDLFDRYLNQQIKGVRKIRIEFTDKVDILDIYLPESISPICHIHKSFDFDNYFAQSKTDRRKIILETLYDAVKNLCKETDYDLTPFTIAYEKVKELNYENKFIYGKLTSSPNRKLKAGIQIEVTEEKAILSVVFSDAPKSARFQKSGRFEEVKFLETLPHYMFIYRLVHKGKWTSSNIYTVSDKSRQVNFDVSFTDKISKLRFEPKTATIEVIENTLKSVAV